MDRIYLLLVEVGKRNILLENIEKIFKGLGIFIFELFKYIEEGEDKIG